MESLTAALKGVDALVSTVAGQAMGGQTLLIDAAIAAGVKRFIPSEYGSCTTDPKLENFPMYAPMWKVKRYLQEKAKAGELTWTVVATGGFMDYMFLKPIFVDFKTHTATLYDDGNNRLSSTSMPNIGKAIVGVLKNFEATKNRIVRTSEIIVTQNQVLRIVRELMPEVNWEVTSKVSTSAILQAGVEEAKAGNFGESVIMKILAGTAMAGETYGSAFDETDNELLGIKELSEEDLKKIIAEYLTSSEATTKESVA